MSEATKAQWRITAASRLSHNSELLNHSTPNLWIDIQTIHRKKANAPDRLFLTDSSEAGMTKTIDKRMTAEMEGEFVVFLIGMRINKLWKLHKWIPVLFAMPRMLKELDARPESGCLGHSGLGSIIVQYWRSFEHLEAYARARDKKHWPAWVDFNRRFGNSRGDVGIWHETYLIKPGNYESVYSAMPPVGLGKVGTLVPATGKREDARSRITGALPSQ